jgi:phosphoribosyl 1,2-cyclic phosphodiesterase
VRISILGSGSSGNCALVESGATRVLVDAGLSRKTLEKRLAQLPDALAAASIDAVLVTHEHSDHVGSAGDLERPVFAPGATLNARGIEGTRVLADQRFTIGALAIHPVPLLHDADETVGYVLSDGRHRVGILTDNGEPADYLARAYAGCDVLVLEANHDPRMLLDGPYPPSLQRRVRGKRGHLSNAQAAQLLGMILAAGPAPRVIVAAHVSQRNNCAARVDQALRPAIPAGTRFLHATPLGAPCLRLPLPSAPGQLALFSLEGTAA